MTIDRSKRVTFEEEADLYDEIVSEYPEELIEDILRLSGIDSEGRILEIGCGSGNATVSFARRGYRILGIELGEQLAALAAKNCRAYPGVTIQQSAFEDWEVEEKAFDLALAADSFHWIPAKAGYPKVSKALKDSGSAAFFWRVPVDPKTDWSRAIDALYQDMAPEFVNPDKRFTSEWLIEINKKKFKESGCFGEVKTRQYFWSKDVTADKYIKGLRTFSMHHGINEEKRERLYGEILAILEQIGEAITLPRSVVLFHSKVKR